MIQRTPVKSSNIRSVGYDPARRKLHVEFHGKDEQGNQVPGNVYEYVHVQPDQHAALMGAVSVGSHFHKHIRSEAAKHPARCIA